MLRRRGSSLMRTSAVAALVAVVLGVASLLVVLALMSGYREALRRGILAGGGHLVAMFPGGLPVSEADHDVARVASLPGVESAGAVLYLPGLLSTAGAGGAEIMMLKASAKLPPFVGQLSEGKGRALDVALGDQLARRAGVGVGAPVLLQIVAHGGTPTTVSARVGRVFHTGFAEIDQKWAIANLAAVRRRVPGLPFTSIEVWLRDPDRTGAARVAVDEALGGRALVTTWQENNRNLFAALRWQKLSLGVVLSLVLGVGAFEVASALVVLVTEKRRHFGVLLALGGEPKLIRTTLLLAGGSLGAAGVIGGMVLGLALVAALSALGIPHFAPDIASIYGVDHIPFRLQPTDLAAVAVLGIAEVLLAALLPARRAAARDPVEVLRWV
jgi:lipoprotein-releasing system permease protein